MVQRLGKHNFDKLVQYHPLLRRACVATVESAITLSRVRLGPYPTHDDYQDAALKQTAARICADLGVPEPVAQAYARLTKRQTRSDFILELARTVFEGLRWVWERLCSGAAWLKDTLTPKSVGSSLVKVVRSTVRRTGVPRVWNKLLHKITTVDWLRNRILQTVSWASKHPQAVAAFEEAATILWSVMTAITEESAKKAGGLPITVILAMVENVFNSFSQLLDDGALPQTYTAMLLASLANLFAHIVMSLLPLPAAILLHAIYNYFATPSGWLEPLLHELECAVMLDEIEMMSADKFEYVPITTPANMVAQSTVFTETPDGEQHYIRDDELLLNEMSVAANSQKPLVIESDCDKLLVKPSNSFLNAVLIEAQRLEKPLPYEAEPLAWKEADYAIDLWVEKLGCNFKPLDSQALIEYIEQRPWTLAHKEETIEQIRKWAAGSDLARPDKIIPKQDEIIPNQPAMAEPYEVASKTRPITPKAEADIPGMAVAVPLKSYLEGRHMWSVTGYDTCQLTPIEAAVPGVFTFSMTYIPKPRSDWLGEWMTDSVTMFGFHVCMHGDDHYAVFVDENGDWLACALDMVNCDKSCGLLFQRAFMKFVNVLSNGLTETHMSAQFALLTGKYRLMCDARGRFFWNKKKPTTNTGEPLTSVKAVFGQKIATVMTFVNCWSKGRFQFHRYREATLHQWKRLGLIPEFEENSEKEIWFHPSGVTFLGGMFVHRTATNDWAWSPNKFLKSYFIFPAVEKIYGTQHAVEKHMLVLINGLFRA